MKMNLLEKVFVLMVLGICCVSLSMEKRCPYETQNCQCINTSVTCTNMMNMPQLQTGSDVIAVDTLQFNEGNLTSLPSNSLPPGLKEIGMVNIPLSDVANDAFQSSANTLNILYFSGANFNHLPDALNNLTNLTDLTFLLSKVDSWNNATLQHIATTLRSFSLINVDLNEWPYWLSFFPLLSSLDVSDDEMSSIPDDAFNLWNYTLTKLMINLPSASMLPKALGALLNLTSLDLSETLVMNFNQLSSFPIANTLLSLSLRDTDQPFTPNLSKLKVLTDLDLSENYITNIAPGLLPLSLTSLTFNNNRIAKLTALSFTNLTLLKTLDLSQNPLSTITNSTFKDLASLQLLDLSSTVLTELPKALLSLSNLQFLDLSSISALTCPCPLPPEWDKWYKSYKGALDIDGVCSTNLNVTSYLGGSCQIQSSTTYATTSKNGSASLVTCNIWLKNMFLIVLVFNFYIF